MGKSKSSAHNARKSDTAATSVDAIELLKADHREVEELFELFEKADDEERKEALATRICNALKVHTAIEEEIFYPAFLEATDEKELHHEAEVEHEGAKELIQKIEAAYVDDDYYDAKVKVLSEMIKHHVKEEERQGGMFDTARKSEMDLEAIGEQLLKRKSELEEMVIADGALEGRGKTSVESDRR